MNNIVIKKQEEFDDWIMKYQAILTKEVKNELKIFQDLIVKYVIKNKNVQMLEYKGEQIVIKLFEAISLNIERLLPKEFMDKCETTECEKRVVADYISGMTDSYAVMVYNQLFSPDEGSMFKKL